MKVDSVHNKPDTSADTVTSGPRRLEDLQACDAAAEATRAAYRLAKAVEFITAKLRSLLTEQSQLRKRCEDLEWVARERSNGGACERVSRVLSRIRFPPSFDVDRFAWTVIGAPQGVVMSLRGCLPDASDPNGTPYWQGGRKYYLSNHATDGEIVQTALLACLQFSEHEIREGFLFDHVPIFRPHQPLIPLRDFTSRYPAETREAMAAAGPGSDSAEARR